MPAIVDDGEAIGRDEVCIGWVFQGWNADAEQMATCLLCGTKTIILGDHAEFRNTVTKRRRIASIASPRPLCDLCQDAYAAGQLPVHPNWSRVWTH